MKSYSFQEFSQFKNTDNFFKIELKFILKQLIPTVVSGILLSHYIPYPFNINSYCNISNTILFIVIGSSIVYCGILISKELMDIKSE